MKKTELIVPWDPPSKPQSPTLVAYSISGSFLHAVVDGNLITAYDLQGRLRHRIEHPKIASACSICSSGNTVYICDAANTAIHTLNCTEHGYILGETFHGPFKGRALLAATTDAVFAVDCDKCKVSVFDCNGIFTKEFDARAKEGEMQPAGIAVSEKLGLLVVSDCARCCINAFSFAGKLLRFWGRQGEGKGQFVKPSAVAFDEDAYHILVADTGNDRIQAFDVESLGTIVWILDTGVSAPTFVAAAANDLLWGQVEGIRRYRLRQQKQEERSGESSCKESKASAVADMSKERAKRTTKERKWAVKPGRNEAQCASPVGGSSRGVALKERQRKLMKIKDTTKRSVDLADSRRSKVESDHKDLRALQDELTDLEEVEAQSVHELEALLRKQRDLESELSVLNELQGTFESEIALSRLNLRDASNTSHPILKLATAADVEQCTDKLALEEKNLELKILQKNTAKELPGLEEDVASKAKHVDLLEEELANMRHRFEAIPKSDKLGASELTEELESHRATIMEQEKLHSEIVKTHEGAVKEKAKEKENLCKQLQDTKDTLRRARQEAKKASLRHEVLESKSIELAETLSELDNAARGRGETSIREVLENSFAKADAMKVGKLDPEGIVEAYALVGAELPAYQETLKAIDVFTVKQYLDLAENKAQRMELEQFIDAFYDITS